MPDVSNSRASFYADPSRNEWLLLHELRYRSKLFIVERSTCVCMETRFFLCFTLRGRVKLPDCVWEIARKNQNIARSRWGCWGNHRKFVGWRAFRKNSPYPNRRYRKSFLHQIFLKLHRKPEFPMRIEVSVTPFRKNWNPRRKTKPNINHSLQEASHFGIT